jgi:phenylalanyl-tRNA synthetase beta chain
MIITRQWLNEFVNLKNESTQSICIALNSIGLEVDQVNEINIAKGVVVGFVTKCEKHPDADKLNVCQVDLGNESVQIVCGASNVKEGIYVPVATVGTILGDNFKIKKAKLRGEDSFGMICSSNEIGLAQLYDGIMPLDDSIGELILGKHLQDYPLINDTIIEIELTANRGDCLSMIGVAKDLSAYFNIGLNELDLKVHEDSRAVGRFLEIDYANNIDSNLLYRVVDTQKFELSLLCNLRVATLGIKRNTQIETLIEYCTHSTGVLLNAYTQNIANKDNKIHLKIYNDENGFTNIDGNIHLSKVAIESGIIIQNDKTVVLEASYCEPTLLAQKVFNTKQKTGEIYYKSSRGTNSDLEYGMNYITNILSLKNATIFKGQVDLQTPITTRTIGFNISKLNDIIGEEIPHLRIENILTSLGFIVKNSTNTDMTLIIPNTRHDVVNIADVTEEIVRMVGIDNIKAKPLAIKEVGRINKVSNDLIKKNKIRSNAIGNSFYETITYIFSSKQLLQKYGFDVVDEKLDILNPINEDLNTFRTNMYINLLLAVSHNVKHGYKSIALFEYGIVFDQHRNEYKQMSFVYSGLKEEESLNNSAKSSNISLFEFAQKLTNIIGEFELETSIHINEQFFHPYQSANIIQNGKKIGFISKIHPTVANDFDVSNETFLASLDFESLNNDLIQVHNISKYQRSIKDLSIVVPKDMQFKIIKNLIKDLNLENLIQFNLIDIYTDDKLENNESLTIRFILQSNSKTLEENDINNIMNKIIDELNEKLNLSLR